MKKHLLFVIESLSVGGAEKSLVTLLNRLDYSEYEVDLLLFAQGGPFQALLPKEVNLLPIPEYFSYTGIPWHRLDKKLKAMDKLMAQLSYSVSLRVKAQNHIEKAVLLWKYSRKSIAPMQRIYDVAIAYAQGLPTFFVAEKVNARKKLAWVNAIYQPKGKYLDNVKPVYERFDVINTVSSAVAKQVQDTFEIPEKKITCMKDILDTDFARKMAHMPSNAQKEMSGAGTHILTVGRLAAMKGYDLAIDAAKILRDRGIDFTWYALGDGALRCDLEKQIANNGLQGRFVLLGSRSNPYPYYDACNLYVQPSRHEGFGITLAEAKMFRKPIVVAGFEAVSAQITNKKNGLIVEISASGIAEGIIQMLTDTALQEECVRNLQWEKIGNEEEIEKFYRMIEE